MPGKSTVNGTFSIALFDFRIQKFHVWQVAGENLAYTIHFYANTHKQDPLAESSHDFCRLQYVSFSEHF